MPWLKKGIFFVGNISLGVMIFFAAADPEGNCHEKCQQLGDGNGKPDTVRAIFFVDGFAVPVYGKGYVMKYGDKYRLFSVLTTDSVNEMVKKAADRMRRLRCSRILRLLYGKIIDSMMGGAGLAGVTELD
ncbi:MAG: hypothetical protein ACLVHE_03390 [Dialister invisus]